MNPIEASKIITDEYSAKILVATYKKPKSALELSHRFGIPIAACYRRMVPLKTLEANGPPWTILRVTFGHPLNSPS